MKTNSILTAVMMLCFVASGCSSLDARFNYPGVHGVYPGVKTNLGALVTIPTMPFSPEPEIRGWGWALVFWLPVYAADLPLSFAVDTLFLPFDLAACPKNREKPDKSPTPTAKSHETRNEDDGGTK
jgi:uncharacterized protein YceK